jgi:hypothetical protein
MIFRELFPGSEVPRKLDTFSVVYITVLSILAFVTAKLPYKYWRLEKTLGEVASEVSGKSNVKLHCNSLFESVFYEGYSYGSFTLAGLAKIDEKKILLQYPWCRHLMNYLDDPEDADKEELFSVPLFTHEVMHIRGERNEQKTECQSVQRNHVVAMMLGVPKNLALSHADYHYEKVYPDHAYFDRLCTKGGKLDERNETPIW